MPSYEVHVTVTTEKTYAVTVEADDPKAAHDTLTTGLVEADVTEFEHVRDVTGWQWVSDDIGAVHEPNGTTPLDIEDSSEPDEELCDQCGEAESEEYGMCSSCLHNAYRSGWTPGE